MGFGWRGGVVKIKGVRGIAADVNSFGVDEVEFAVDMRGFGVDDAAGAPETVDNLADKAKLKGGLRLEFLDERREQEVIFGGVLFESVGIDDDFARIQAVLDGIHAGNGFALRRAGAG